MEALRCQAQGLVLGEFAEDWRPCEEVPEDIAGPVGRMGAILRSAAYGHEAQDGDMSSAVNDMSRFLSDARLYRGVASRAPLNQTWPQEYAAVEAWSQDWKEDITPNEVMEMGESIETAIRYGDRSAEHSRAMREWWSDPDACDVGRTEREKALRTKMLGHDTLADHTHPIKTGDDRFAQHVGWIIDASVEDIDEADGEGKTVGNSDIRGMLMRGCERIEGGERDPVMREACAAALNWCAQWPEDATLNDVRRLGALTDDIVKHKQSNDFMIGTLRRRLEADGVPRERWHPVLLGSAA